MKKFKLITVEIFDFNLVIVRSSKGKDSGSQKYKPL